MALVNSKVFDNRFLGVIGLLRHIKGLCFKRWRILMTFLSCLLICSTSLGHHYQQLYQSPLTEHFSLQLKQNQLVPFLQPWWTVKVEFHYSRGCCYWHTSIVQRVLGYSRKNCHSWGVWHFLFQFLQFLEYQQILLYFSVWSFL